MNLYQVVFYDKYGRAIRSVKVRTEGGRSCAYEIVKRQKPELYRECESLAAFELSMVQATRITAP